ncbi:MAG: Gfo/Idh/MocA family oxidoreductase [Bacteroidota bacterium]
MLTNAQKPVKIGVSGAGKMASNHARVIASNLSDAVLVGVYDPDSSRAEDLAATWGVQSFSSFDELLQHSEAVIIASATDVHFQQASQALQSDKHVLVEKPVCATFSQALRLQQLAHEIPNCPKLQVGHIEHFNPSAIEVMNFAEIIEPLVITAKRLGPHDLRTSGTDVVSDLMLHDIHIVTQFTSSDIKLVTAVGISHPGCKPDYAHATLAFQDGTIAQLTASRITEEKQRVLNITAKDVHVTADYTKRSVEVSRCSDIIDLSDEHASRYQQDSIIHKLFVPYGEPLSAELRSFVASIQENQPVAVDIQQAVRCMELVDQINQVIHIQERKLR